jgi:hypothetical protein
MNSYKLIGAEGGSRTRMNNCSTDFKSVVYTDSTTPAWLPQQDLNLQPSG